MQDLKTTIIQTELVWEDIEANLAGFDNKINTIKDDTHLIILPEMFTTGFSMNAASLAQDMTGSAVKWLREKSRQKNADIVGSIIFREDGKFFNRLIWTKKSDLLSVMTCVSRSGREISKTGMMQPYLSQTGLKDAHGTGNYCFRLEPLKTSVMLSGSIELEPTEKATLTAVILQSSIPGVTLSFKRRIKQSHIQPGCPMKRCKSRGNHFLSGWMRITV